MAERKTARATIVGTTCDGKPFVQEVEFELIPPKPDGFHYGTGCYMTADRGHGDKDLIDVRYERTTDLRKLAEQYIKGYYGKNAHEVRFMVPMPGADRGADY